MSVYLSDDRYGTSQNTLLHTEAAYDIKEVKDDIEWFLTVFVPSKTHRPLRKRNPKVFESLRAAHLGRRTFRENIMDGLNQLMKHLPLKKRLDLVVGYILDLTVPSDIHYPPIIPDIVALAPGEHRGTGSTATRWQDIVFAVQASPDESDDPMSKGEDSLRFDRMRTHLRDNARNLLLAHSALFCFVLGFYGNKARIFRFDRARAIASLSFDYRSKQSVLDDFLWRFVHPAEHSMFVGADSYVSRPTFGDMTGVEVCLMKSERPMNAIDKHNNRWVTIPPSTADEQPSRYLTLRMLAIKRDIFSRQTHVREAVAEDNIARIVLKDAWRHNFSIPETIFYDYLKTALAEMNEEPHGLIGMVCGVDLGTVERRRQEEENRVRRVLRSTVTNCTTAYSTMSASYGEPESQKKFERSLTRIALDTVGRSLATYRRTKELVEALRAAIIGHRQAYRAGILHRDVSQSNVMIADDRNFKGFLIDFDFSSFVKRADGEFPRPPDPNADEAKYFSPTHSQHDLRAQTGTPPFMAIELMTEDEVTHTPQHDLESFYWVLISVVLGYADHTHPEGSRARAPLFNNCISNSSEQKIRKWKEDWLDRPEPLKVRRNEPLTELIARLTLLMKHRYLFRNRPLTYDMVLKQFDDVLGMPVGWPPADAASSHRRDASTSSSTRASAGESSGKIARATSAQKRPREDDDGSGDDDPDEDDSHDAKRPKRSDEDLYESDPRIIHFP